TGLFPASVRARCVGFVYHAGAVFAAAVPTTVAALSEYGGMSLGRSIALVAGGCQLALVAALLLRPKGAFAPLSEEAEPVSGRLPDGDRIYSESAARTSSELARGH